MTGNLSNTQLETLKASTINIDDKELSEFKKWIQEFKIRRLPQHLDKVWEEKNIHPDELLGQHMKTPYNYL